MYYYIINPSAGRGAINQIQDRLRARLDQLGINGEFSKTTGTGDAAKIAARAVAKGCNTIVAVGGDDTVNEVINGVTKENVAVGIIPIGSSNVLANRLGIHTWQQAVEVLAARRITAYSLIAAGQKFFLSTLTLGFETDLTKQVDTSAKGWEGYVKRFGQGWGRAQDFTPLHATISIDDQYHLESQIFSLTAANQKFENPLLDNQLVIRLHDKPSNTQLPTMLWNKLRGKSLPNESASTKVMATRAIINTEPSSGIMVDGKVAGRTPIAIRLTDRRIRFITEKPTEGLKA
jgi:diacylglycerol kinase (ATP)